MSMFQLKGERLALAKREATIEIWTNGRTLGLSLDQAREIMFGLEAILDDRAEHLCTADMVETPRAASDREYPAPTRVPNKIPNLEDI